MVRPEQGDRLAETVQLDQAQRRDKTRQTRLLCRHRNWNHRDAALRVFEGK
ncbi:hypothetical protein KSX_58300 [Ktedonospora formicarum]|uniref:Uncharacterized protein n=1 Tax=Ktedonospora formicarum TaxID=2778364 RepID=A0A8J3MT02_9CHLR|nr:hypothetical protein KSX_58300 [Ktedonospora formicarum]